MIIRSTHHDTRYEPLLVTRSNYKVHHYYEIRRRNVRESTYVSKLEEHTDYIYSWGWKHLFIDDKAHLWTDSMIITCRWRINGESSQEKRWSYIDRDLSFLTPIKWRRINTSGWCANNNRPLTIQQSSMQARSRSSRSDNNTQDG